MLTKVSIIGLSRDFVCTSQYAKGMDMTSRMRVVISANWNVNMSGVQFTMPTTWVCFF